MIHSSYVLIAALHYKQHLGVQCLQDCLDPLSFRFLSLTEFLTNVLSHHDDFPLQDDVGFTNPFDGRIECLMFLLDECEFSFVDGMATFFGQPLSAELGWVSIERHIALFHHSNNILIIKCDLILIVIREALHFPCSRCQRGFPSGLCLPDTPPRTLSTNIHPSVQYVLEASCFRWPLVRLAAFLVWQAQA